MSLYYVEKLHITDKIYAVNLRAIIAKLRVYVLGKEGTIFTLFLSWLCAVEFENNTYFSI